MSTTLPEQNAALDSALRTYPTNAAEALNHALTAAGAGDTRGKLLAAYWLWQQGRQEESITLAEAGRADGVPLIGWWIGQQGISAADPALRSRAGRLLMSSLDSGPMVDLIGLAQSAAAQGNLDLARDLLDAAAAVPSPVQARLDSATLAAEASRASIEGMEARAATGFEDLQSRFTSLAAEGEDHLRTIVGLRDEVGSLAHMTSADYLKRGYGQEAKRVQSRADWTTGVSVLLALVLAGVTANLARGLPDSGTLSAALEKGALTLPFVALNIYLARLGSVWREEALRWRHIKLQIETASPFLGGLDDGQRKETLALLATRFFPGQALPMSAHAAEPSDLSAALASMLQHGQRVPKVTIDPSPPAPGSPSPER